MNSTITGFYNLLKRYVRFGFKVLTARGMKVFLATVLHFFKSKAFKLLTRLTITRDTTRLAAILVEHAGMPVLC